VSCSEVCLETMTITPHGRIKMLEICEVHGKESLKYIQEFYMPICYCSYIDLNDVEQIWLNVIGQTAMRNMAWAVLVQLKLL